MDTHFKPLTTSEFLSKCHFQGRKCFQVGSFLPSLVLPERNGFPVSAGVVQYISIGFSVYVPGWSYADCIAAGRMAKRKTNYQGFGVGPCQQGFILINV